MAGSVFLSGSLPDESQGEFMAYGVHPRAVDEAVTALTRSVLRRGMRLVFGGHPAISPLVAMAALHVRGWGGGEPPIVIYQCEAYRKRIPEATWALFRSGAARIVWTEAKAGDDARNSAGLKHMRERMLGEERPDAMVCVGGMGGVVEEVDMFQDLRRDVREHVYVLAGTGGAAAMLAGDAKRRLQVIDREEAGAAMEREDAPIPYPYLLSRLVDEIAGVA